MFQSFTKQNCSAPIYFGGRYSKIFELVYKFVVVGDLHHCCGVARGVLADVGDSPRRRSERCGPSTVEHVQPVDGAEPLVGLDVVGTTTQVTKPLGDISLQKAGDDILQHRRKEGWHRIPRERQMMR